MTEVATAAVATLVIVGAFAVMLRRDDLRLRRRARLYRQLEQEGIEQLRRNDPYPEQGVVEGGFLREPSGARADTDRVLHEELERAREHTRMLERRRRRRSALRRGKGTECLV
jgi:hypothetical protein